MASEDIPDLTLNVDAQDVSEIKIEFEITSDSRSVSCLLRYYKRTAFMMWVMYVGDLYMLVDWWFLFREVYL